MIRLTYASSTAQDYQPEQLLELLKTCRKNNSAQEITGILLYANHTFFQILEGEEEVVNQAFSKIKKDPRHYNVTLIDTQKINERSFPYWSMGFEKVDTETLNKIEGMNNFFAKDFSPDGFLHHKEVLAPLIKHLRNKLVHQVMPERHEELPMEHEDPFIQFLHRIIRASVQCLALLMTLVILLGVIDVLYVIYQKLMEAPFVLLTIEDLLDTFGAFLAVLIAIEIFLNITLYIRSDVIPVKLVVATALMAISRKVIVFDFKKLPAEYVSSSALVIIALGVTYWLVQKKH